MIALSGAARHVGFALPVAAFSIFARFLSAHLHATAHSPPPTRCVARQLSASLSGRCWRLSGMPPPPPRPAISSPPATSVAQPTAASSTPSASLPNSTHSDCGSTTKIAPPPTAPCTPLRWPWLIPPRSASGPRDSTTRSVAARSTLSPCCSGAAPPRARSHQGRSPYCSSESDRNLPPGRAGTGGLHRAATLLWFPEARPRALSRELAEAACIAE